MKKKTLLSVVQFLANTAENEKDSLVVTVTVLESDVHIDSENIEHTIARSTLSDSNLKLGTYVYTFGKAADGKEPEYSLAVHPSVEKAKESKPSKAKSTVTTATRTGCSSSAHRVASI